jgi:hypothetical protein
VCPQDGTEFKPKNSQQVYCSHSCKKASEHASAKLPAWLETLKDDALAAAEVGDEEERWQAAGLLLAAAAAQGTLGVRLATVPRFPLQEPTPVPGEWLPRLRVSEGA